MVLEGLMLREGSQRKTSYDFNPMKNLKEENKQTRHREQTGGFQRERGMGGRVKYRNRVMRCKLPATK